MTLSIFPQLFTYSLFAIFLMRITLALVFIKIAFRRKNKKINYLFIPEIISALFVLFGLYTQIAVLFIWFFVIIEKYIDSKYETEKTSTETLILLEVFSISLLFLGAGAFAFDMPL